MITERDLEYHHDETADFTWSETYYIPISIPEERLFGHIYICARPVLGSMQADIRFHGAVSETEFELLYCDTEFHLPAPERFSRIETPYGLTVTATRPPRDYRVDYTGYDDTEIHLDLSGIMHPWDIHDADLNPLAGGTPEEQAKRTSMGSAYKGHFDMHHHAVGTVKLHGREFQIDNIDRMNHSWGPRPERKIPPTNSVWAQFGADLCFRFHLHLDPEKPAGEDQRLAHGYLLDHGEVFAIVDAEFVTIRQGIAPITLDATITDTRGKSFRLRGRVLSGGPWRAYALSVCWVGLYEWECAGEIGFGSFQENHSIVVENRLRGRGWKDRIPAISA